MGLALPVVDPSLASSFPYRVTWDITHRCNLRCKHCFVIYQKGVTERPRDEEKIREIAKSICSSNVFVVSISGGEPFAVDALPEIISEFCARGILVAIATNGLLVDEDMLARVDACKGQLNFQVSLDGATRESHEFIRGSGTFEPTVRALKRISKRHPTTLAFTLTTVNSNELEQLFEIAYDAGCHAIKLQRFVSTPSVPRLDLCPVDATYRSVLSEVGRLVESGKYPQVVHSLSDAASMCCKSRKLTECTVAPNGDVYRCGAVLDVSSSSGNLFEESLESIWPRLIRQAVNDNLLSCLCSR